MHCALPANESQNSKGENMKTVKCFLSGLALLALIVSSAGYARSYQKSDLLGLNGYSSIVLNDDTVGTQNNQVQTKIQNDKTAIPNFGKEYPFSKEEFLRKLEKLFETQNGQITKEMLREFVGMDLEDFAMQIDSDDARFTKERFYLEAEKNWYFEVRLNIEHSGKTYLDFAWNPNIKSNSEKVPGVDAGFCIHYNDFRSTLKKHGWKLKNEFSYEAKGWLLDDYFIKENKGQLLARVSRRSSCITSFYIGTIFKSN
jgi:hypothetical protein